MHHLYPLAKGDPLCPLGFHPQVRWPTRCKRCFRDYKEHGGRRRDEQITLRRDDATSSTPSLSTWGNGNENRRSWSSSSNLAVERQSKSSTSSDESEFSNPSSWESTPDLSNLNDNTQANIPTVNIKLPMPKRKQKPIDTGQRTVSDSFSIKQDKSSVFSKNDSLAMRAKKLQAMKDANVQDKPKRIHVKEIKAMVEEPTNHDVQFLIQVKAKSSMKQDSIDTLDRDDDAISLAGTETTDTTLVDHNESELREQVESLKKELDSTKSKCDRLEKEKSNILLRRLTAMETTSSKNTAAEVLKLQQRCNELQSQLDDYKDEKKILSLKVKELEEELELRPTAQLAQKIADELRSKLLAAETLCEELMDENEDMKKELRDLEDEMEEMQDNFREDQADEYTSLKKELEQTTKNCRILSFKLRKTERKVEQLETEKNEAEKKLQDISGSQTSLSYIEKIKNLEKELNTANEKVLNLQKDLEDSKSKTEVTLSKKKAPMLGSIGRFSSDGKVSRESLTRGGSQEDPAQLLRDLQDSLEREADLREQLKFAEEEAQNLRKKASRIEDDNESLVLQLKKMATRARSRKLSPTNNRLSAEMSTEKDEGISDDEDISELKLQLELSEQEASVLRKKVEELEADNDRVKRKTKELQDKLTAKTPRKSLFGNDKEKDEKIKGLEEEMKTVRRNLLDKERECDRLNSEINLGKKRSTEMQKSKSSDLDQQTVDLKRQLQVIEQEASVFRTRVQNLENENDKLIAENKRLQLLRGSRNFKSDKVLDKYIDQIATLEVDLNEATNKIKDLEDKLKNNEKHNQDVIKLKAIENERDNLANIITKLKQDSVKAFKDRTPKKPSELTSKSQLKTMVSDLENEIGEILVTLNNVESSKLKLEKELQSKSNSNKEELEGSQKELEEMKNRLAKMETELKNERAVSTKEKTKYEELNRKLLKSKETFNNVTQEKDKLKNEIDMYRSDYNKLLEEKVKVDGEVKTLKLELGSAIASSENSKKLIVDMDQKDRELSKLKTEVDEKTKINKELEVKSKKLIELEKQILEAEEKLQKNEKSKKVEIKQLQTRLEDERKRNNLKETEMLDDNRILNTQIDKLNNNIASLESTIKSKNLEIEKLEDSVQKERAAASSKNNTETKQIRDLNDELNKYKNNLKEVEAKLETTQKNKKSLEEKLKVNENDHKVEKLNLEKKISDYEIDLQNERKKIEVFKSNYEKEHKNRELELGILRNKIKTLEINSGAGNKKITEIKQEYQDRIDKIESKLAAEKQEYLDLTGKYEILEEEHVVTKAKLVTEKESLNNQLSSVKKEMEGLEKELQTLRDTYNTKHDTWIKEKLQIQEKLKEHEKSSKSNNDLEKVRLKSSLGETQLELEQLKKEYEVVNDQMEYLRKENDELKKKLVDFDKVSKIQRNISADSSAMDKEIRQLKNKIVSVEKAKKSDVAEYKLRYESQIHVINEELRSLQTQVTRFKRERDTYKHMLEGAQKTIGDLKSSPSKAGKENRNSIPNYDELEEYRTKVATLDQQISCMEDELSEARLESSKVKTELVSERSTYEVKLSELHSRVNELEEEKILSSGRTKIAGLRTRMELAWHKEREEQQRLLQETATLARDLRQTLYEVERERDKERLEARRKQEQIKKTTEEEQEETKRKLTELQCDLLELRDAHAKLRTTNEKLRREKERHEREREEMKNLISDKKRSGHEDERRINVLIEQVEALMQIAPELCSRENASPYTPTPPRRIKGSKSRESSPAFDQRSSKESSLVRDDRQTQLRTTVQRLVDAADNLRRFQKLSEEDRERERIKRTMGMRRATSTEHDNGDSLIKSRGLIRNGNTSGSLHRKSLSLEQTSILHEQTIWKGESDSVSSMQSLDFGSDTEGRWSKRDNNLDSRLSGGSTQSEATGQDKKKKKSLIGKLKQLTKSRSIDDQDPRHYSSTEGLSSKQNSNSDITDDNRGSKRDLKERFTGMFKRGGSSSRSNSLERQNKVKDNTSSTQRPLMHSDSNSNMSSSFNKTDGKRSKK